MSTLAADKQASFQSSDTPSGGGGEQRTHDRLPHRGTQLTIVAACVAAVVLIALIALHTSPIADGYGDLVQIGHASACGYLDSHRLNLTDRYGNAIFMVALATTTPSLFDTLGWFKPSSPGPLNARDRWSQRAGHDHRIKRLGLVGHFAGVGRVV